jgi:hypothetical protein
VVTTEQRHAPRRPAIGESDRGLDAHSDTARRIGRNERERRRSTTTAPSPRDGRGESRAQTRCPTTAKGSRNAGTRVPLVRPQAVQPSR